MAANPKQRQPRAVANPSPQLKEKKNRLTEEDQRDIRDARRELARAKREGVIPLRWLIEELEQ
jgi:hypothetical protein